MDECELADSIWSQICGNDLDDAFTALTMVLGKLSFYYVKPEEQELHTQIIEQNILHYAEIFERVEGRA